MEHIQMVSLRLVREGSVEYQTRRLSNADAVYQLFRELAEDLDREAMWVLCLDVRTQVTCLSQISLGTLKATLVHPREVLKVAVMSNSDGIMTIHNHPSGDPSPSAEDRAVTKQLRAAAETLAIKFLDHIIVGNGTYFSFADHGSL